MLQFIVKTSLVQIKLPLTRRQDVGVPSEGYGVLRRTWDQWERVGMAGRWGWWI